jgi:hypothetical protein
MILSPVACYFSTGRQNQESGPLWFQIRIIFSVNKYNHTNLKMKTDIRISLNYWIKECTISNLESSDPLPDFVKVDCADNFSPYNVSCKLMKASQVFIYHIHRYPHQSNAFYLSKTILYSLALMFSSILVFISEVISSVLIACASHACLTAL